MNFSNPAIILSILKRFSLVSCLVLLCIINSTMTVLAAEAKNTNKVDTISEQPKLDQWQVYLQSPTQNQEQSLWQGQANQWLIVSLNPPNNVSVELPLSSDFSLMASSKIVVNEDGKTGWAYPLRIIANKSGHLTIPEITLISTTATKQTASKKVLVKTPQSTNKIQLEVSTNKQEMFIGQSIRLTTSITIDYPIAALSAVNLHLPILLDDAFTIAEPWNKADENNKKSIGLPVNGDRQIAHWQSLANNQTRIYFDTVLKPNAVGQYQLPAATMLASIENKLATATKKAFKGTQYLAYYNNKFFEPANNQAKSYRILEQSSALTITVNALPSNAPEYFSGIVGRPVVAVTAQPSEVKTGEPIQYTMNIIHPDIETLALPALDLNPSFTQSFNLPAKASTSISKTGSKIIKQSIFPRRADIAAIPAITVNYFEPESGIYRDFIIESLPVSVTENDKFIFSDIEGNENIVLKNTLVKDNEGIWALRWQKTTDHNSTLITSLKNSPWSALFLLLCPPLVVALMLLKPMQKRLSFRRSLQPIYRLKQALEKNDDPLLHLSRYFYQRLDLAPSQFNAENVKQCLTSCSNTNTSKEYAFLSNELVIWVSKYQARYAQHKSKLSQEENKKLFELVNKLDKNLPRSQDAAPNKVVHSNKSKDSKKSAPALLSLITTMLFVPALFSFLVPQQAFASDSLTTANKKQLNIETLQLAHHQALQLDIDAPHKGNLAHAKIAQQLTNFIDDPAIEQSSLLYDIGTSWFQAGKYGQSVLWLRRAENKAPNDDIIRHNLAKAREERLDQLPDNFSPPWLNQLHLMTSQSWWLGFCWVTYCVFWLLIWRRFSSTKANNKMLVLAIIFVIISCFSQIARYHFKPQQSEAVMTSQEVVSRKGPGLIFSPAFTAPLHEGAELIILKKDGQWSEVKLTNGANCWLPTRAITVI
ncbi:hypothetical protein RI844_09875 [Thalassotalea fonticola]|uniref:Protein BatD n=1 Tax=Thalassotalea fonticola TaxID=3065649 RepID=A0ABZ0GWB0_9GAMM|nr:hypothetical protein RI844_09875 [Colwelliaceae bacterium S1-1]